MKCTDGNTEHPLGKLLGLTGENLARANKRLIGASGLSLSFETSMLIHWLSVHPGTAQHDVRHCMNRDKARIARVIDSLEKQGLVRREIDEEDRRIKRIHLTEKGRELDSRLSILRRRVLEIATLGIPEEEVRGCRRTLMKIINNLEKENHREAEAVISHEKPSTVQEGIQ